MAKSINHDLALAILRACNISTDNVVSVDFSQDSGRPAEITVSRYVFHTDPTYLDEVNERWECVEESHRG